MADDEAEKEQPVLVAQAELFPQTHVNDDLSPRMIRLARFLERLPPGKRYLIVLVKPQSKTERWMFEVSENVLLREMEA